MPSPRIPALGSRTLRRLTDLDGAGGWAVNALIVAYVVGTAWWRVVPIGPGVGFLPLWTITVVLSVAAAQLVVARRDADATRVTPGPAAGREGPRRRLTPLEVAPLLALPGAVLTDITMLYQPLRDLGIYLKAGQHFVAGMPVYIAAPLQTRPDDLSNYPFLYPPLTLPFFGALSLLPEFVAQALWVAASVALGVGALRLFGLRWRWAALALLWPPMFQGLLVGNVSVPALALFALAPAFGSGLVLGAISKSYTGLAALWLVRERRWLDLLSGVAIVAVVAALTLPLTGLGAWRDWLEALSLYQTSQQLVPALYGLGLTKWLPVWAFVIVAGVALAAALLKGGKEGLARLGTATVVASPSLWGHGVLMAVPSILSLRPMLVWLAIAIATVPDGIQWWWLMALIGVSWAVPALLRDPERGRVTSPLDPLVSDATGPWPWSTPASPVQVRRRQPAGEKALRESESAPE